MLKTFYLFDIICIIFCINIIICVNFVTETTFVQMCNPFRPVLKVFMLLLLNY